MSIMMIITLNEYNKALVVLFIFYFLLVLLLSLNNKQTKHHALSLSLSLYCTVVVVFCLFFPREELMGGQTIIPRV